MLRPSSVSRFEAQVFYRLFFFFFVFFAPSPIFPLFVFFGLAKGQHEGDRLGLLLTWLLLLLLLLTRLLRGLPSLSAALSLAHDAVHAERYDRRSWFVWERVVGCVGESNGPCGRGWWNLWEGVVECVGGSGGIELLRVSNMVSGQCLSKVSGF